MTENGSKPSSNGHSPAPQQDASDRTTGSLQWLGRGENDMYKKLAELLLTGKNPDDLMAKAVLDKEEIKAIAILLDSYFDSSQKPAEWNGIDWWEMEPEGRLAYLYLALSPSQDGGARDDITASLIGQIIWKNRGNEESGERGRKRG